MNGLFPHQAKALAQTLEGLSPTAGIEAIPSHFLPNAVEVATVIWRQANFNDFAYPETEGDRSDFTDEERAYQTALNIVSFTNEDVRLKMAKEKAEVQS